MKKDGKVGSSRLSVESSPGNPSKQATDSANRAIPMNTPGMKSRGFRADQLVSMVATDGYNLGMEAPRKTKMKG